VRAPKPRAISLRVTDTTLQPTDESPAIPLAETNGAGPSEPSVISPSAMVVFESVTKVYEPDVTALRDVTFVIEKGEFVFVVGASGSGKSTIVRLMLKELEPTRGRITFKGRDITSLPPTEIARLGLVRSFQISAVFPHLTCRENIRIALQRKRGGSFDFWRSKRVLDEYNERAVSLLGDVGLAEYANLTAVELPYGRKRALELATTIALDPEMLLLDEPTAGMGHEDIERPQAPLEVSGQLGEGRARRPLPDDDDTVDGCAPRLELSPGDPDLPLQPVPLHGRPDGSRDDQAKTRAPARVFLSH